MAAPVYGHGAVVGSLVVATRSERQFTRGGRRHARVLRRVRRRGALDGTCGRRGAPGPDRSAHGPAEPRALHRPPRPRARARRARRRTRSRCCSSTSTSSSSSTTASATWPATGCWSRSPSASASACARSDTAARLGGDEFAILRRRTRRCRRRPRSLGARIIEALSVPFHIDGHELHVRASIGIATGRDDPESLLRDADIAMYRAKADEARRALRLRARHAGRHRARARAPQRAAARRRGQRDHRRLPADRLARRRPDHGARGARALGPPRRTARSRPTCSSRSRRAPA